MADIREAVRARTVADATVAGLVGDRVRPSDRPAQSDVYPLITYKVISAIPGHHLLAADGLVSARLEFNVYSYDHSESVVTAEALRQLWDGWAGAQSEIVFLRTAQLDQNDFPEPAATGTDRYLYRVIVEFRLKFRVSVPTF